MTILTKGRYFGKETNKKPWGVFRGQEGLSSNQLIHLLHVYSPYDFCNYFQFFFLLLSIPTSLQEWPSNFLPPFFQEEFRLILSEPQSGLSFDAERDGVATQLLTPRALGTAVCTAPFKGPCWFGAGHNREAKKNTAYQPRWLF